MRRLLSFLLVGFGLAVGLFFLFQRQPMPASESGQNNRLKVTVSFYPLAHFTEKVGGDLVEVATITQPGVEPHDYEPTPQDIVKIRSSRLFIFNGNGLDPWAERLREDLINNGVRVIDMSAALKSSTTEYIIDPHIWLDPLLVSRQIDIIREELSDLDSVNLERYRETAAVYQRELSELDQTYRKGLAVCERREVVVSHQSFAYLGNRYRLAFYPIAGISPEAEPSSSRLADLVQLIRQKKITWVFFETLVSSKLAETIARETGAKTEVLNPIEGLTEEEQQKGENYDTIMRDNLARLQEALLCR